jgi:hypothetical protein
VLVEGGVQQAAQWIDLPGMTFGTDLVADGVPPAPAPVLIGNAVDWDRTDVRTAGLDFSELKVGRASVAVAGVPLVHHAGKPLLARSPSGRSVHCAFRLADANLWLLPAFPQLLRRCYAAAHADLAKVGYAATNLVDATESDLRAAPAATERPLPEFGAPAVDVTAHFALAALVFLALRVWGTRAA